MTKTLPHYLVEADRETGLWLNKPSYIGEVVASEWYSKQDTDECHFDCYEQPIEAWPHTETCAVEVVWVD